MRNLFAGLCGIVLCAGCGLATQPLPEARAAMRGYTQSTWTLSNGVVIAAEVGTRPAGGSVLCTDVTGDTIYTGYDRALGYNAHIVNPPGVDGPCSSFDVWLPPGQIDGGTMEARCRWGRDNIDYGYECNIILLDVGAGGAVGASGVTLGRLDFKANHFESTELDRDQPIAIPFHGWQSGHLRLLMYQWDCAENGGSCPPTTF